MRSISILFLGLLILASCSKDTCTETVVRDVYTPVYKTKEDIRAAVKVGPIREVQSAGALYVYEDYLMISDPKSGIHIFDNSNPINPIPLSFIEVEGNTKLAVQNNYLYADNYIDLLVFDLSDMNQPQLINNMDNILMSHYAWNMTDGVVIDYIVESKELKYDCDQNVFIDDSFTTFPGNRNWILDASSDFDSGSAPTEANIVGIGGSLAKFTLAHNRLYVVDDRNLQSFDLSNPASPEKTSNASVGWNIETIFPYKTNLFIGSQSGMFIYDASNPDNPVLLSTFEHARNCDPVFATDNRAYVTLRNGTECEGFDNQLDVIDISILTQPTLIKSYAMDNPHGLSVRENSLYLCEGDFGLKIFDISDDNNIDDHLLGHLRSIQATDVISLSAHHLLVIGQEGLYQLDVENPANIRELSLIAIQK